MKNPDSHIILYAKGWYKRTDIISDLRKLYSIRCGIDEEFFSLDDIYKLLTRLVSELCFKENGSYYFYQLMTEMFKDYNSLFRDKERITKEDVIKIYLSFIRQLKVKDIENGIAIKTYIELDEPDYTILLRNKEK